MGLEFVIIQKVNKEDEITLEKEVHRFPCEWFWDLYISCAMQGQRVYTTHQVISFGKSIIETAMDSFELDNYSKTYVLKLVDAKEIQDQKLQLIRTVAACSKESYEHDYAKHGSRFELIAKIATCDSISPFLSLKEIEDMEKDFETTRRLVHFGLQLIQYGEKGYMGYWSC
jgi:hypothetical protein